MEHCRYCGRLVPADQLAKHVAEEKKWSRREHSKGKIEKQPQGKPVHKTLFVEHQELPHKSVFIRKPWDNFFAHVKWWYGG
jgi:hypothetical protein